MEIAALLRATPPHPHLLCHVIERDQMRNSALLIMQIFQSLNRGCILHNNAEVLKQTTMSIQTSL